MKILATFTLLLCAACPVLRAGEAPLFRMTAGPSGEGGNGPAMIYQEVARNDGYSTVEATAASGSVAAKSMFLMRATCALMKERQQGAFRIEQLSKMPIRFNVRFVAPEPGRSERLDQIGEGSVISAAQCDLIASVMPR